MTDFFKTARKFFTNKILVLIIVFAVLIMPAAVLKQAQGAELAHALAVGIDYNEGNYVIYVQVLVPKKDAKPDDNIENINAEAGKLDELIQTLQNKTGKEISFENADAIIIANQFPKGEYEEFLRILLKRGLPYSAELAGLDTDLEIKIKEINELDMKKNLSERLRYEGKNEGTNVSVGKFLTSIQNGKFLTLPCV